MNTKQVIVIRKDLKMRRGKEIAQGSHASQAFITKQLIADIAKDGNNKPEFSVTLSNEAIQWLLGLHAKITCSVNSLEELLAIKQKAEDLNVECNVVTDLGFTEFNGVPTITCLALGPDDSEKINQITGKLTLY